MTHLVKSHETGDYYTSEEDPLTITKKCNCGDRDLIIMSWEDGKKKEALECYFSKVKRSDKEVIEKSRENNYSLQSAIKIANYSYLEDRNMITNLFEDKIITRGELRRLTKLNRETEIKQLEVVRDCFRFHTITASVGPKYKLLLKKAKK